MSSVGDVVDSVGSFTRDAITNRVPASNVMDPAAFPEPSVAPPQRMSMEEEVGRLRAIDPNRRSRDYGRYTNDVERDASGQPVRPPAPLRPLSELIQDDYVAPLTDMGVGENSVPIPKPDVKPIWMSGEQIQPSDGEMAYLQQRAIDLVNQAPTQYEGVSISDIKPEHRAAFIDQVYRAARSRGNRGGQNRTTKFLREAGRSIINAKEGVSRTAEAVGDYLTGAPPRTTPEQAAFERDVFGTLEAGNNPTLGEPTPVRWALQAVPSATTMALGFGAAAPLAGAGAASQIPLAASQTAWWTTQIAPGEIEKIYATGKTDRDTATIAGLISAGVQGAIEQTKINPFKGTPGISGLRARVLDVLKTYGEEILVEEGLQAAVSEIVQGSVTDGVDPQKVVDETIKGVKEAMGPGVFLVGSGGAVNIAQGVGEAFQDYQGRQVANQLDERTQSLEALDATRPAARRGVDPAANETDFTPPDAPAPTGPGLDRNAQPPSRARRADESFQPKPPTNLTRTQQGIYNRLQSQPPEGGFRTMRMSEKDARAVGRELINAGYEVTAEAGAPGRVALRVSAEPSSQGQVLLEEERQQQQKPLKKEERQQLETRLQALTQTLKVGGLRPREVNQIQADIYEIEQRLNRGGKPQPSRPKRVVPAGQETPTTVDKQQVNVGQQSGVVGQQSRVLQHQPAEVKKTPESFTTPAASEITAPEATNVEAQPLEADRARQPEQGGRPEPAQGGRELPAERVEPVEPAGKIEAQKGGQGRAVSPTRQEVAIPKPKKAPRPSKPKARSRAADSARRQLAREYDDMASRGDIADIGAIDAQINDESTNIETLTPAGVTFTAEQAGEARQLREMLGGGPWANSKVRILKEGERFPGTTGDEILHELAQKSNDPMGLLAESIRRQSGGDTSSARAKQVMDAALGNPELMRRMDPQSVHAMRVLEALESGDKEWASKARKVEPGKGDVLFQEQLKVGDEFEIAGDKFRVIESGEDGTLIKDGVTLSIDPGEPIAVDSGTAILQQISEPQDVEEDDTSFDVAELEAQTAAEEAQQEGHSTELFGQDIIEDMGVGKQGTLLDAEGNDLAAEADKKPEPTNDVEGQTTFEDIGNQKTSQDFKSEQANRIVEATRKRILDGDDVAGAISQSRITKLTKPDQIRVSNSGSIQIMEGRKLVAVGLNEEIRLANEAGIEYEYPPSDKVEEPSDDRTTEELLAAAVSVAADDVSQLRAGDIDRVIDEARNFNIDETSALEWLSQQDLQERAATRVNEYLADKSEGPQEVATRKQAPTIPTTDDILFQTDNGKEPNQNARVDEELPFTPENISAAFRINKGQGAAVHAVANAMALDTENIVLRKGRRTGKRLVSGGKSKGAVDFTREGQAIIWATGAADVSTGLHELAHVARRTIVNTAVDPANRAGISDEDIIIAEQWAGADGGDWSRAAEEKFARGFERYMRDGTAPTKQLKGLFETIRKWLGDIYRRIKGSAIDVNISPEMRGVYDKLITRGDPGVTIETPAMTRARRAAQEAQRLRDDAKAKRVAEAEIRAEAVRQAQEVLPVAERGKVITQIRDARTPKTLQKATDRIAEVAADAEKTKALNALAKAMLDAKKAKLRPEYRSVVDNLTDELSLKKITEKTRRALRATADYLERNSESIIPPNVIERLRLLNQTAAAEMKTEDIEAVTDAIKMAVHLSKLKNQLIASKRAKTQDEAAGIIIRQMDERVGVMRQKSPRLTRRLFNKLLHRPTLQEYSRRSVVSQLLLEAGTRPEILMEHLSPMLRDMVWEDIGVQAYHVQEKTKWEFRDALRRAVDAAAPSRMFTNKFERWRLESLEVGVGKGQKVELTRDEIIWLYTTMRDPTNREIIMREGVTLDRLDQNVKITPDAIEEHIGPAEKAISDHMFQQFNGNLRRRLNDEWVKVYGFDIANVENYVPRRVDMYRAETKVDPLQTLARMVESTLTSWGSLKARVGSGAPLNIRGAMDVYMDHVDHVSRIAAYLAPVTNAHAILGRSDIKQAIIQRGGKQMLDRILNSIQMQTVRQGDASKALHTIRQHSRLVAAGILGLRISPMLKNPSGLFIAASYQGGANLLKSAVSGVSPAEWKRVSALARKHSPYWRTRYDDFTRQATAGVATIDRGFGRKSIPEYGLVPLEKSDEFGGVIRWRMAERYIEQQGTPKDAPDYYDKVAREWERSMFRSENTSHGMELSGALALGRRSAVFTPWVMFSSSTSKIYSAAIRSALAFRRGDYAEAGRAAVGFLGSVAWASLIGTTLASLRRGGDDDDEGKQLSDLIASKGEDMARRAARDVANMVPVFGSLLIEPALRVVLNERRGGFTGNLWIDQAQSIMQGVPDIYKAIQDWANETPQKKGAMSNADRLSRGVDRLLEATTPLAGVPYGGVRDLMKIFDGLTGGKNLSDEQIVDKQRQRLEKKLKAVKDETQRRVTAARKAAGLTRSITEAQLREIQKQVSAEIPADMKLTDDEFKWLKWFRSAKSSISKRRKAATTIGTDALEQFTKDEMEFYRRAVETIPDERLRKKAG